MSTAVQNILEQIDRLDQAAREELRLALQLRSRQEWERNAQPERIRSRTETITDADVDNAVEELRYGKKAS